VSSRLSQFFAELRERKVTRTAVAYAVVGTATAEGVQLLVEALELPRSVWQTTTILILLGFPVALILAWVFERTPRGLRMTDPQTAVEMSTNWRGRWPGITGWVLAAILLVFTGWQALEPDDLALRALARASAVERAVELGSAVDAFRLAQRLPSELPDTTRERLLNAASAVTTLATDPVGARVSWRPFDQPEADWEYLGTTPVQVRLPQALVAVRFERHGYVPRIVGSTPESVDVWELRREGEVQSLALRVPGGSEELRVTTLSGLPQRAIGDFLIDRYEVTNREYQQFIHAGGYERRELWTVPFMKNGRQASWEEATAEFVDRAGRPGPSTWRDGSFPEGTADHPITGISWYEAAAYARFVGRNLPTVYHWYRAASVSDARFIIPWSNLEGAGLAEVGRFAAVTRFGAYDMAGNAREWLENAAGELRYTAGGGWNDPDYAFYIPQPQDPFDRSATNGFRLITDLGDPQLLAAAADPIERRTRDYATETPVSDETFGVFPAVYAYDKLPLDAVVEAVDTIEFGIRERISFDAAYGERMLLYLFLPFGERGDRLQTIVYFPGNGAINLPSFDHWTSDYQRQTRFLVESGRAVAFPVYKGTFERQDGFVYATSKESSTWRDHVIKWRQDLARSIDYLETRPDIDRGRLGYFGFSWGGLMAPVMLALEPRIRAAVIYVAGFSLETMPPVIDPLNFAPRVRAPALVMNARYDYLFPLESSAVPFFEHLGSHEKEHYVSDGGHSLNNGSHFVPWDEVIRETLRWLDRHLGSTRAPPGASR
jgi:eukaryotic-like serine/threonine-protein kinase